MNRLIVCFIFYAAFAAFLHSGVHGHVSLTFPPARTYAVDYLTSYSLQPCGMPRNEDAPATTFIEGTTFTATWQLSYPHAGGNKLELIKEEDDGDHTVIARLSDGSDYLYKNDTTIQHIEVTLPKGVLCEGCALRLLREGAEYGSRYFFISCADVTIIERPDGLTELASERSPTGPTAPPTPDPYQWIVDWIERIEGKPRQKGTYDALVRYLEDVRGTSGKRPSTGKQETFPYRYGHTRGMTVVYEDCYEGKCLNGGTCDEDTGNCACHRLYSGDRCQLRDECWTDEDCTYHGRCIDTRSTTHPKLQCYCEPGWFGVECERESALTEVLDDYANNPAYSSLELYPNTASLHWRYLNDLSEVEMAIRIKTRSWVGVGWRPRNVRSNCKILDPVLSVQENLQIIEDELRLRQATYNTTEPDPHDDPEAAIEKRIGSNIERRCRNRRNRKKRQTERYGRVYGSMDCADMVVGAVKGNLHRIRDRFTIDCSRPEPDEFYGGTNDLTAAVGRQARGYTTLLFRKRATTNHYTDHAVNPRDEMKVLWARGQETNNYSPGAWVRGCNSSDYRFYRHDELKYHGFTRGQKGSTFATFRVPTPLPPPPPPCTSDSGSLDTSDGSGSVSWVLEDDFITFILRASQPAGHYVGLGISDNQMMPQSDIYTGMINHQGQASVVDRYATARSRPPPDDIQEVGNVSGSYQDGELIIQFTRPRTSLNPDDLGFSDGQCRHLLFARGPVQNGEIAYHDFKQVLTSQKVCIRACPSP